MVFRPTACVCVYGCSLDQLDVFDNTLMSANFRTSVICKGEINNL